MNTILDSIIAKYESGSKASMAARVGGVGTSPTAPWLAAQGLTAEEIRLYAQERAIVAATEAVERAIEQTGISRTEVAKRMGTSKGHISQVLSGARNMTLRTLGDLLWAAGFELRDLDFAPLERIDSKSADIANWPTDGAIGAQPSTVELPNQGKLGLAA
jgi:transcriptional regulator with XRE-family HTH domain